MKLIALAAVSLVLVPFGSPAQTWEKITEDDGVTVYARDVPASAVRQMKAYGTFQAPPARVMAVIADLEAYTKTMPYVETAKILKRTETSRWFYAVINAPLVSRRDYCIKITYTRYADGTLTSKWIPANEVAPKPAEGIVRIAVNEGHWILKPIEGGKATKAKYYVHTDPGGSVAKWIVNRANSSVVPEVFESIREALTWPAYANAQLPEALREPAVTPPGAPQPAVTPASTKSEAAAAPALNPTAPKP